MGVLVRRNASETVELIDAEGPQMSIGRHDEGHFELRLLRAGRKVFSMTKSDAVVSAAFLLEQCAPDLLTPELCAALDGAKNLVG